MPLVDGVEHLRGGAHDTGHVQPAVVDPQPYFVPEKMRPGFAGGGERASALPLDQGQPRRVRKLIERALREAGGSRLKAVSAGLKRMQESGLITEGDLKRLKIASAAVFHAENGRRPPADTVAKLDRLYRDALADPGSSVMGTTMIGMTYSARTNVVGSGMGLFGMLIGGLITGGPGGALIGGLVGWVAGTACSDEND